jgi:drug/metabolite transporter (DMT)-like permease
MPTSGLAYAVGAAVTWGLVYTIDQRILSTLSPFALLFINSLLTSIGLLPVILIEKTGLTSLSLIQSRTWLFIAMSLILAALANFFIFSSIKLLGAATASIFEIAYPFFVILFACFAFGSKPSLTFLLGALLMFIGASIVLTS